MHSLRARTCLLFASAVVAIRAAAVPPVITPAPERHLEAWKRQTPDPIELASILYTAVPQSLRQLAATNIAAVSSILGSEFLDDNRPQWFSELPWEIQSYLIQEFGPTSAWFTASPTASPDTTASTTDSSAETSRTRSFISRSSATSSSRPTSIPSSIRSKSSSAQPSSTLSPTTFSTSQALSQTSPAPSSSTSAHDAPNADNGGLTNGQKIGMGVGIPLGIIVLASLLFGCCFLLRRRQGRHASGSERASSPGFIPHFAFQDKSADNLEHRVPLNPNANQPGGWEDAPLMPAPMDYVQRAPTHAYTQPGMTMADTAPIMAPVLHTHSSNRARGRRTSYNSLHAPECQPVDMESPILGRHPWPKQHIRRTSIPEQDEPTVLPNVVKRKPVSADLTVAIQPELSPHDHSGSTLANSHHSRDNSDASWHIEAASPVSPLNSPGGCNHPEGFGSEYAYSACKQIGLTYGAGSEFSNGYADVDEVRYGAHRSLEMQGGNRSLDTYKSSLPPLPPPPRRMSRTEWPLRNVVASRRVRSPAWDRVYDE